MQTIEGPHGRADELPLKDEPGYAATVCHWLITSDKFHPFWTQWFMGVVRLSEVPNMPPARHQFEGTTHEFLIVSLNPEFGDKEIMTGMLHDIPAKQWSSPQRYLQFTESKGMPYLEPPDVAIQFEASDDEMRQMAKLCAEAIVLNGISPDQDYREVWKASLVKTLAHIRGEEHAP